MSWTEVKVFTLNVYGILGISPYRKERVSALCQLLRDSDYDVIMLQEVWTNEDYQTLRAQILAGGNLRYSQFYDNGIIGSGTCIFTRHRVRSATFHEFGVNGYPHSICHGDWFAAKGLGIAVLCIDGGFDVHLYVSHYHAEYDPSHDAYAGHRCVHALESAHWIQLTSVGADLTIYAGDFNTEPHKVPYKIIRHVTPLRDAWEEVHGPDANERGSTSETHYNSFTPNSVKIACPEGKRIDYIMYRPGPDVEAYVKECKLPLSRCIPGKNYSYSDHEAVEATICIRRKINEKLTRPSLYMRALSSTCQYERITAVGAAINVIEKSIAKVESNRRRYLLIAALAFLALILSFLPSFWLRSFSHIYLDIGMGLPRFVATVTLTFYLLMGTLFSKREQNQLTSTQTSLKIILDIDKCQDEKEDL